MELDDFKSTWKKHNTELDEKLVLNVNSLTEENLSKSQNELFKPLIHEIANIFVIGLTIIFIAIFSFAHLKEIEFSIPGFAAVFLGAINVYYAIVKAHRIYLIDYYKSSIIEIQKNISSLNLLILKYRRFEIALFPLYIIFSLPITFKVIQNRNLYADLSFFLLEAIFIIVFGFLGLYFTNKYFYDKRIKKVQLFLDEIKNFKNEKESVANIS